jgi:hypothetical protein
MATSTVPNAPELAQTIATNADPTPVVGNPNVAEPNNGLPLGKFAKAYGANVEGLNVQKTVGQISVSSPSTLFSNPA